MNMDKEIFDRILNLIKKTEDKIIIVGPDIKSAYVVMSLDDYERTVGGGGVNLTGKESTDKIEKINQDIAMWREEAKSAVEGNVLEEGEIPEKKEEESQFYFEPVE
jgi:hypothetical protein